MTVLINQGAISFIFNIFNLKNLDIVTLSKGLLIQIIQIQNARHDPLLYYCKYIIYNIKLLVGGAMTKGNFIMLILIVSICNMVYSATDPGNAGTFLAGKQTYEIPATQNTTLSTDVHYPKTGSGEVDPAAALCPVIVFGHGFSRSKEQYVNIGAHLASRGFIVMIPNFSGSDHSKNADDFSSMLDWIIARNNDPSSIFYGHIDTTKFGSSGHSAGGMSALVASSRDSRFRASSPMDPVDNNDLGKNAMPLIHVPVSITYSEPHSCNSNGSAMTMYNEGNPQKRGVKIIQATHCDPEDPTNFLCTLMCGSQNSARMYRYRKYMTGWFEFYLHCDASYEPWVFGEQVQADLSEGYITYDALLNPPAPTGVTTYGTDCITISRDEPSQCNGITGWRVYRSTTSGSDYTLIAEITDPSITSWTDTNTTAGVTYYYIIRDYYGTIESPDSAEVSITPSESCEISPPPGNVGNNKNHIGQPLTITKNGLFLRLSWGSVCDSTDYSIYRGTLPLTSYNHSALYCSTNNQITFDIVPSDLSYYFLVVARTDTKEGSYGEDSNNNQIPQGSPYCLPQTIGNCN